MKGYPGGLSANCGPSTAGRSWEGEVRERADDVFFALGIKRCQSNADFAPKRRPQTGAQRQRVRFGSEEQQNKRAMSFAMK